MEQLVKVNIDLWGAGCLEYVHLAPSSLGVGMHAATLVCHLALMTTGAFLNHAGFDLEIRFLGRGVWATALGHEESTGIPRGLTRCTTDVPTRTSRSSRCFGRFCGGFFTRGFLLRTS